MGIHDRDYYRDQYRRAASSKRTSGFSGIGIALFWIAVMAIAFAAFRLLPMAGTKSSQVVVPPKVTAAPAPSIGARPSAPIAVPRSVPVAPERAPVTTAAPIYRCGNSYVQAPCAGGRIVDTTAASGFDSRPSERLARQVADGRSAEESQTSSRTVTTTIVNGTVVASSPTVDHNAICGPLAVELAALDREALRPQSAASQDLVRRNRNRVRNQQLQAHC